MRVIRDGYLGLAPVPGGRVNVGIVLGRSWNEQLARDGAAPLTERILAETAMALLDVVRADEGSRISVCADEECEGVVLDLSRNRSRRYCSTTCTNRNAVAAYRARRR
jgi:predicted RNA-binding Zn ribbon-like protein